MNINVYQLWDAIGGVDQQLINEIQEYGEIQKRKRRNLVLGLSAAACIMLCVLSFHIINYMIQGENMETQINQNNFGILSEDRTSNTNKDIPTVSEPSVQQYRDETVEINKGDRYFNTKYGGTIQQVTKELWAEKFHDDIFIYDSNTKYFFSYSKEKEVLYGVLEIKSKNHGVVTVLVGKNAMIDSEYNQLSKTNINGIDIALCSIGDSSKDGEIQYGAVYSKSHIAYTIEWSEGDLSEFIEVLKDVVRSQ